MLSLIFPVPGLFLWSLWSESDKPCGNGTQERHTLCGDLRRRLPLLPGKAEDDPAVMWPSCLMPLNNSAPTLGTPAASTGNLKHRICSAIEKNPNAEISGLKACADSCNANAACLYWMFDFESKKCSLYDMLNVDSTKETINFVSGERSCISATCKYNFCPSTKPALDIL